MDKDKRVEEVAAQVFELDHNSQVDIRDALNIKLRGVAFQRLERFFKEKGAPVDAKTWREWQELRFLLGSGMQTLEEGAGVLQFIEFARSAYFQTLMELVKCGVLLEKTTGRIRNDLIEKGGVEEETLHLLTEFQNSFFRTLEKSINIEKLLKSSHHGWNQLRGHTKEEYSKLVKMLFEARKELDEENG